MRDISLIPFVCGAGGSTAGAERGPLYCFEHDLPAALRAEGISVDWQFDPHTHWAAPYGAQAHTALPVRGDPRRRETVQWHNQHLAQQVAAVIRNNQRAVTIGGDHSMAAGSMAGAQIALGPETVLGLVWVDAHTDLHTFASSTTKALHGMPVGSLLGLDDTLAIPGAKYPVFTPDNVVYVGLRDVDPGEILHAEKIGLPIPSIEDLRAAGLAASVQNKINALKKRCDHILLSIDLDAFAETLAPAVGTLVPGGFTFEEIIPILRKLVETHSVPLIEVVEFNPTLLGTEPTYALLTKILRELLKSA